MDEVKGWQKNKTMISQLRLNCFRESSQSATNQNKMSKSGKSYEGLAGVD